MTPKEKANELVDKYWLVESDNHSASYIDRSMGKKCALIAVDEILKLQLIDGYDHEYWQEVKQEIKKL